MYGWPQEIETIFDHHGDQLELICRILDHPTPCATKDRIHANRDLPSYNQELGQRSSTAQAAANLSVQKHITHGSKLGL